MRLLGSSMHPAFLEIQDETLLHTSGLLFGGDAEVRDCEVVTSVSEFLARRFAEPATTCELWDLSFTAVLWASNSGFGAPCASLLQTPTPGPTTTATHLPGSATWMSVVHQ